MQTITLASIYELQGLKDEALEIYQEILKQDPNNHEAKVAIKRLVGKRKQYDGVNEQMKEFFISMDSKVEYLEFERWLLNPWN